MDTTKQSVDGGPVPVLPPIGVVTRGPHADSNRTWVGSTSRGNTREQAFDSLLRHATPFQGTIPSVNDGVLKIPGFGPVHQYVDPNSQTIVNMTEPGHVLHPGSVVRSIVQDGNDRYISAEGYGNGILPGGDELAAPLLWKFTDQDVRSELNPQSQTPLTEQMGAVGSPSGVDTITLPQRLQPALPVAPDNLPIRQRIPLFSGPP